jgi:ABC-type transport system involved in cytochrome bd biosynthesis fused ATPase/permease subunit
MFERLKTRAGLLAEAQAARRRDALAARLTEELPAGIAANLADQGVELSGRGLKRRLALEPPLRALFGRLR